jgi:hypothetical protein
MSFVTLVIADGDNDKSSIPIDFSGAFSGDIDGLILNVWAVIAPLVTGHLESASITLEADITDLVRPAAAVLSDVQEKAQFVFESVGGYLKTISIPTFLETLFTNDGSGKGVDITDPLCAAFITMMEDGVDDGGGTPVSIFPTTSHGEDLANFVAGRQAWGKNRV